MHITLIKPCVPPVFLFSFFLSLFFLKKSCLLARDFMSGARTRYLRSPFRQHWTQRFSPPDSQSNESAVNVDIFEHPGSSWLFIATSTSDTGGGCERPATTARSRNPGCGVVGYARPLIWHTATKRAGKCRFIGCFETVKHTVNTPSLDP